MRSVSGRNFGLLIAYIVPGVLLLLGIAAGNADARLWLRAVSTGLDGATIGGFLHMTLASVGAGLTASTIRWAVVDPLHHATGIERPRWDDSQLQAKLGAFDALVENHYRYYQFYTNSVVGLVAILIGRRIGGVGSVGWMSIDAAIVAACILFWAASRDCLKRYYSRASVLLGAQQESEVSHDERTQSTIGTGPKGSEPGSPLRGCGGSWQGQAAVQAPGEGLCIRVEGWPTFVVGRAEARIVLEVQAVSGRSDDASESA